MQKLNVIVFISFIDEEENESSKKRAYSSFGKLILAKESSFPSYSFGNAQRDPPIKGTKGVPGPIYNVHDKTKYKKVKNILVK